MIYTVVFAIIDVPDHMQLNITVDTARVEATGQ